MQKSTCTCGNGDIFSASVCTKYCMYAGMILSFSQSSIQHMYLSPES